MAASRVFNGVSETITLGVGTITTTGAHTMLGVVKYRTITTEMAIAQFGNPAIFGLGVSGTGKVRIIMPGANSDGLTSLTAGKWYVTAISRPAGVAQTVRMHILNLTDGGPWVHENSVTTQDNSGNALTNNFLGSYASGSASFMDGMVAAAAFWPSNLSDAQVENAGLSWQNLLSTAPQEAWLLNQSSPAQPVLDGTSGGSNEVSHVGTTVSGESFWGGAAILRDVDFIGGRGAC